MIDMNNREEVIAKLEELKGKNLPKMNHDTFFRLVNFDYKELSDEEIENANEYLEKFYDYTKVKDNSCIFSEEIAHLRWGLAHGVAIDENTGLSWKTYHYLTVNGAERRFTVSLQYHPDCYTV